MCTCTRFKGLNTGWNTVSKWQQNHWPAGARTRTSPKPNWQVLPKTCSNEFPPNLSTRPFRLTSPCSNNRWNCTQGRKPGHRQCGNEGGTQIHPVQNPGPHYRSAQLSPQRTRDPGDQCGHGRDPRENDKFGRPSATHQAASAKSWNTRRSHPHLQSAGTQPRPEQCPRVFCRQRRDLAQWNLQQQYHHSP